MYFSGFHSGTPNKLLSRGNKPHFYASARIYKTLQIVDLQGFDVLFVVLLAEREGFEPPVQLPVHRISSAARSTTPASLLFGFPFRCQVGDNRPRPLGSPVGPVFPRNRSNGCFGTANIDIIFIFPHFPAEKIASGPKNYFRRASCALSEYSYLCPKGVPRTAGNPSRSVRMQYFAARAVYRMNDNKCGTIFVLSQRN